MSESTVPKEIKMTIIPRPDKPGRAHKTKISPTFIGEGNVNYVCEQCGTLIAERVNPNQIMGFAIQCPTCGEYNKFPEDVSTWDRTLPRGIQKSSRISELLDKKYLRASESDELDKLLFGEG